MDNSLSNAPFLHVPLLLSNTNITNPENICICAGLLIITDVKTSAYFTHPSNCNSIQKVIYHVSRPIWIQK